MLYYSLRYYHYITTHCVLLSAHMYAKIKQFTDNRISSKWPIIKCQLSVIEIIMLKTSLKIFYIPIQLIFVNGKNIKNVWQHCLYVNNLLQTYESWINIITRKCKKHTHKHAHVHVPSPGRPAHAFPPTHLFIHTPTQIQSIHNVCINCIISVSRGCTHTRVPLERCDRKAVAGTYIETCYCNDNDCNTGSYVIMTFTATSLSAIVLTFYSFFMKHLLN